MNKISVLLLLTAISVSAVSYRQPSRDDIRRLPTFEETNEMLAEQEKERRVDEAFDKIKPRLEQYAREASPEERGNFANYVGYYRSWGGYQAVSPAPREVTQNLTKEENKLAQEIKRVAEVFVSKKEQSKPSIRPETQVIGRSTLSPEGDEYYQRVIDYINNPTFDKPTREPKPMREFMPTTSKKPAHRFKREE